MITRTVEQTLLDELRAAATRLGRRRGGAGEEMPNGDLFDAAQVVEQREHEGLAAERLTDRVRRLAAALERLRAGGYGVCRDCGGDIPAGRLRAMPATDTCVACQETLEHAAGRARLRTSPAAPEQF